MKVKVFKIPQASPDDVSGIRALLSSGRIHHPSNIVAIMGKTEGNGCVNDFTRGFAVMAIQHCLTSFLTDDEKDDAEDVVKQIVMVMSGGCEGVMTPHLTLFVREDNDDDDDGDGDDGEVGLVVGRHHTRDFEASEIGTLTMVQVVSDGVKEAMKDARVRSTTDVHFVQIKCPLIQTSSSTTTTSTLTTPGTVVVTNDSYKSMAYSRAASALGVAVAMGEVSLDELQQHHNAIINVKFEAPFYSSVASTSAGVELRNCEILVLGNAPAGQSSDYVIGHDVMHHALDASAVSRAITNAIERTTITTSNSSDTNKSTYSTDDVIQILAKAEADPRGSIRLGTSSINHHRHTMMDDSDINHTRMARAVVAAVLASVIQDPCIYVSGGAEHQGPSGGGPVAVLLQRRQQVNQEDNE